MGNEGWVLEITRRLMNLCNNDKMIGKIKNSTFEKGRSLRAVFGGACRIVVIFSSFVFFFRVVSLSILL